MRRASRKPGTTVRAFFGADAQGPFVALSRAGAVLRVERGGLRADLLELYDAASRKAKVARAAVREIAVDRGPAGFSSVRRRVTVAAGLAHALKASVAAVGSLTPEAAAALPASAFARAIRLVPQYDRAPNITAPKRKPGRN